MGRKRKLTIENDKMGDVSLEEAQSIIIKNKEIEGLSIETVRNYKKFFKHLGEFMKENEEKNVSELTEKDAKNFIHFLITKGLQNNTINSYITNAKGAFKILDEEDICVHIFKNIKYLKEDEKAIIVLSLEEVQGILKSMDLSKYTEFRDYVMIHVLIDTFSRIGETLALKKQDVDLENQTITFNKTKSRKIRTVPISRKTAKLIRKLIKEVEEFNNDYIFQSWNGKPLENSGREVSTKMKEYAKRAGVNKRVYPHLFRHTASAHFIKETGNIRVLQKILGHSDITVTQRYAHVLDSVVHDLHDKYSLINALEDSKKRKTKTD